MGPRSAGRQRLALRAAPEALQALQELQPLQELQALEGLESSGAMDNIEMTTGPTPLWDMPWFVKVLANQPIWVDNALKVVLTIIPIVTAASWIKINWEWIQEQNKRRDRDRKKKVTKILKAPISEWDREVIDEPKTSPRRIKKLSPLEESAKLEKTFAISKYKPKSGSKAEEKQKEKEALVDASGVAGPFG